VPILVALDKAQHKVTDAKGSSLHTTAVIPAQHLLVFSRAEESNIACLVELIHGILEAGFVTLLGVRLHPRCSILKVSGEHRLGTVGHEKGRVAGSSATSRSQDPDH
jgi:hypothetical protein